MTSKERAALRAKANPLETYYSNWQGGYKRKFTYSN